MFQPFIIPVIAYILLAMGTTTSLRAHIYQHHHYSKITKEGFRTIALEHTVGIVQIIAAMFILNW